MFEIKKHLEAAERICKKGFYFLSCFFPPPRSKDEEGERSTHPAEYRDRNGSGADQKHEPTAQQRVQQWQHEQL